MKLIIPLWFITIVPFEQMYIHSMGNGFTPFQMGQRWFIIKVIINFTILTFKLVFEKLLLNVYIGFKIRCNLLYYTLIILHAKALWESNSADCQPRVHLTADRERSSSQNSLICDPSSARKMCNFNILGNFHTTEFFFPNVGVILHVTHT